MIDDSVQPGTEEQTITATDAAGRIGITIDQLRMWSQPDQFGRFLAAPKAASGRRRYTDHDIAVCQLIHRWHEQDGLTYRDITQRFETNGVDRCLQMALGTEATNKVLQDEADRLRTELNALQLEKGRIQDERARLLEQNAALQKQWNDARAVGLVVTRDLEAKQLQAERDMEYLEQAQQRAARHLQEAYEAFAHLGFWSWLTGGRQRATVHLKEAQLAYAEALERVATMRSTIQQITMLPIQRVLRLTAGDEAAATAEPHKPE